jgi:NhaA family Na+:H+ antiporter
VSQPKKKGAVSLLLEFSIPLLAGVAAALLHANLDLAGYRAVVGFEPFPGASLAGHTVTLQFLVDEVFMALFFGIAAKEITEACLPGGSLNPLRRAVNPLLATVGGVLGPILVYFAAFAAFRAAGAFAPGHDPALLARGWGIPTATDIALAWLVARAVFGPGHPAIDFLLLLAVADDAIGLVIIACFYPDPLHPIEPVWLFCALAGPALAWALRARRAMSWQAYVFLAGPLAWWGLLRANLHPALALVLVVPFMPGPLRDTGMFAEEPIGEGGEGGAPRPLSPLQRFERDLKPLVDVGLFFFAFANAGVAFAGVGPLTWIVLTALVVGKTCGITAAALLAVRLGFPLPERMGKRELAMAGFVASVGMTVALFVATAAFTDPDLQGEAKMGALFSGVTGLAAVLLARPLGLRGPRRGRP